MAITAKSGFLISMAALILLAPVAASAQEPVINPPAGGSLQWKRERDWERRHHDHDRAGRHDRDRDWRDHRRGDRDGWKRDGHGREWSRNDRNDWGLRGGDGRDWGIRRDKRYGRDFYRDETPAGSYSGAWSAWRDSGNGTYTYSNGDGVGGDGIGIIQAPTRNGPKVLGVGPKSFEGACDRSGGVCIIRPGN